MKILVTGANSMVGDFLLPILLGRGHEVVAVSRRARASCSGERWLQLDLQQPRWAAEVGRVDSWINLAPLPLIVESIPCAFSVLQPGRVIVFSSTSRFTKRYAHGKQDREFAASLARGEQQIIRYGAQSGVGWNILRPTMIYCLGKDRNITQIHRFVRRFRFFPLVGDGQASRQPVHAEDLAEACAALIRHRECVNRAYNLSGGEVLSYREMVRRLFQLEGIRPRFVTVPLTLLQAGLFLMRILPKYRYLTPDMAERMTMDMVFSHDEATRDFGFSPRRFLAA